MLAHKQGKNIEFTRGSASHESITVDEILAGAGRVPNVQS